MSINRQNTGLTLGLITSVLIIAFIYVGGCNSNQGSGPIDEFPEPPEIFSEAGVLKTTIETIISTNFIENAGTGDMDEVNTPTYNGLLTGPTLRVRPGDSIQIDMINSFSLPTPKNKDGEHSLKTLSQPIFTPTD